MSWKNLRVGQKIGVAFAALIILSGVVGAIAYLGFTGVVDRIEKADDANRLIKLAQEIRRHEKNYLLRGDEESRYLVVDSIRRAREQIEDTRPRFRNPANVAQINRIAREIETYEQSFTAWVELAGTQRDLERELVREARQFIETCERLRQSQKQKLADVLARGRAEFEDRLIKADDANRLIKLAQGIRIHEKNFMLRGDETALIEIDRTIDAIGELIDDLDQRFESAVNVAQLSAIRESARRYKLAFDAWVEDSRQKEEKMASMVLSARGMVEQCEALRSDQKRLTETSVGDAIQAIAGILALTILGGLLMGIAITRSIVHPLRGAAEFAGAVAEGDFNRSLRIDQRDEIGDLARSLEVMSGELAAREGEIVEAQQRGFRGIVEAFERGFFFYSTDERGHLTYISPSVANVIGWEPDEDTPHFRDLCTDSPINDEAKRRSEETLRGRTQSSFEVELATPDGRICRLEISEIPVTNDDGRVTGAQGIAHDVTTLIEARAAADQASRAKSAFLANMSHELRTPMNAIIGYSEMLMEDAEDSGDDAQLEDLRKIHAAGQYLLSLINDILDLSKVEAGRMDLYLERFDLAEMVEEVASTVAPLVEKQENTLVCEPAEGLGTMRADLTKVRQTLFNLLSNAAKFTAKGTITLAA